MKMVLAISNNSTEYTLLNCVFEVDDLPSPGSTIELTLDNDKKYFNVKRQFWQLDSKTLDIEATLFVEETPLTPVEESYLRGTQTT